MSKNKKKLRRSERKSQLCGAAQSLVMAGLLLAGSAGMADAASGSLASGESLSITSETKIYDSFTMTGGTLTLSSGGRMQTPLGNFSAGTINFTGESGGSRSYLHDGLEPSGNVVYTFGSGATEESLKVTVASGAGVVAHTINISGGSMSIAGKTTFDSKVGNWYDGSLVLGLDAVNITGGTVTVGDYGQIVTDWNAPNVSGDARNAGIAITGGKVVMAGNTSGAAALLRASNAGGNSGGKLTVSNSGVVEVAAGKYGIIVGQDPTLASGGTIQVDGHLKVGAEMTKTSGADSWAAVNASGSASFNIKGGTLNVAKGGTLESIIDVVQTGGTHNVAGTENVKSYTMDGGDLNITSGGHLTTVSSGNFNAGIIKIDGNDGVTRSYLRDNEYDTGSSVYTFGSGASAESLQVSVTDGGGIVAPTVNISGGSMVISGRANIDSQLGHWYGGSLLLGYKAVNITGGTVTVKDYGQIVTDWNSGSANRNDGIAITGGKVVLAADTSGAAALLRASSQSGGSGGKLTISGTGVVEVAAGKYGIIVGEDPTVASGGLIQVDGHLKVGGEMSKTSGSDSWALADASTSGGSLKVAGGAVKVADSGSLTLTSGMSMEISSGGRLDLKDQNALAGLKNSKVTVSGSDSAYGSGAGRINFREDTILDVSKLVKIAASGSLAIAEGGMIKGQKRITLTSGSAGLDIAGRIKSQYLTVDGASGNLTVEGGSLKVLGKTDAADTNEVLKAGTLTASGGAIHLGDATEGTFGGKSSAKLVADASGSIVVEGGTWETGDVAVKASGSLTVNEGTLDVSKSKLSVASGATAFGVKNAGTLVAKATDFTASGAALDSTVQKKLANEGVLLLKDAGGIGATVKDLSTLATLTGALQSGNGTVKFEGFNANNLIKSDTGLTDASKANTTFETSTVQASGGGTDTLQGNIVVQTVNATNVSGATYTVNTSGHGFGLVGAGAGSQLIAVNSGTTVQVSGDLTLGDVSANSKTGGGILTGKSGSLAVTEDVTAANGDFTIIGSVGEDVDVLQNASLKVQGNVSGSAAVSGANSSLNVTGNVASGVSAVGANSRVVVVGDIASGGVTAANNSFVSAHNVSGNVSLQASSLKVTGLLTADSGGILVGASADKTGSKLEVNTLDLQGKTLFLDPTWVAGTYNPSQAAVKTFSGDKINGNLGVGMNSQLTLGTDSTAWLDRHIREIGVNNWNASGIDSALGIYAPQTLASGFGIVVDGKKTSADKPQYTANQADFSSKSLLVVNGAMASGSAALTAADSSASTANIGAGAKLHLVDARINENYTILKDFNTITSGDSTSWNANNLTTNNRLITVSKNGTATTGGKYVVTTGQKSAASIIPHISSEMAGLVDHMVSSGIGGVEHGNAGVRFVSRTLDPKFMPDAERIAPTLEGAAQLAVVGATQGMTLSAVNAATTAVTTRTSFASPLSDKSRAVALNMSDGEVNLESGVAAGDNLKNGVGLWIMPLYQSNNVWGMKSENFKTGYTSDLGGVALGADYTFADAFRVGLALNMGGGYAQSHGDFSKTDNSFNFWGVNLYGGWSQNNFGITADVGYTGNYNKLKQETPASMQMGDIKADVTSSAITAGLRGEYKFETDVVDIIPHVSVRYTSLTTDGYDAKSNGTVFEADSVNQSIWTFPIGVTFTKDIESASGWIFKPQVDLQVIPAAGDVKAKSKVRIPGVNASADLQTRVIDDFTYGGGVGFDVKKDNVSFGINYTIQASEHSTAHGVFGTFRYEF